MADDFFYVYALKNKRGQAGLFSVRPRHTAVLPTYAIRKAASNLFSPHWDVAKFDNSRAYS